MTASCSGREVHHVYQATCSDFGWTLNKNKIKHMVPGRLVDDSDRESIDVDGGEICSVEEIPYLESVITYSGRMDTNMEKKIAQASKDFGALRKAAFLDKDHTLTTKIKIYPVYVLSVLIYGTRVLNHSQEISEESEHISP